MSIIVNDEVISFEKGSDVDRKVNNVAAFVVLREQLIKNIGMKRVKGFLLRYGYELGLSVGKTALDLNLSSIEDLIKQGPEFHSTYGHVKGVFYHVNLELSKDRRIITARGTGIWKDSFEGLEHFNRLGKSDSPSCYTLTGYISGFMSTICQDVIVAKETSCLAMGDDVCRWEFKPLAEWGEDIAEEYSFYSESPIIKDYEYTYEQLLEQRNYIYKVANLHKKLTEAITNGCNLDTVTRIANDVTRIPVIIDDIDFQVVSYAGITKENLQQYNQMAEGLLNEFGDLGNGFFAKKKKIIFCENHYRLIAPIIVKQKMYGYCTFIYSENTVKDIEIDYSLLERIANASALYFLNEKTSFDTFERMKGHFLEQLLENSYFSLTEILKRGRFMNIDLSRNFFVSILEAASNRISDEDNFILQEKLFENVNNFFHDQKQDLLSVQRQGRIVLLLPMRQDSSDTFMLVEQLIRFLRKEFYGFSFKLGISTEGTQIESISDYYEEALIACRMACKKSVIAYDELGIVGILLNSQNINAVRVYAKKLLGSLYGNNNLKTVELLKTLYFFLYNGGKLEQTMKDLSLSMSGLLYRLKKIESIIGKDLRKPTNSHSIFLVLEALVSIGDLQID